MSLPEPYYTLQEAAAELGTSERALLALAEQDAVDVCFALRWVAEPVRFAVTVNGTREIVERGHAAPLGHALVRPTAWDLAVILAHGSADITEGISYDESDGERTTWLTWAPARRVAVSDLVLPQYEMESLRKASSFYDWLESFELGKPPTAAPYGQGAGGYRDAAENAALPKGERQKAAILWALAIKNYPPLAIPDGEKFTIEVICRDDFPGLFEADSAFRNAWASGIRTGLWRMESHASYSKRSFA